MRFLIRPINGSMPDISLGPPGRELACYLPAGVESRQLNYGQGEGQVMVAGCEWGIYQSDDGGLALVLHAGKMAAEDGLTFARLVAKTAANGVMFEVLLQGDD